MVALQGTRIVAAPLQDAVSQPKLVGFEDYELAKSFFG
jgi:hypothetical protein